MIYYDERAMEGTVNSDAGAQIRDGIKSVAKQGTCFEDGADGWPYVVGKFKVKPPHQCYAAGLKDRAVIFKPIGQTIQQMRGCLAEGYPFVFGFTCYPGLDSDEVASTGWLPMPGLN
jgi:hypothetical protein